VDEVATCLSEADAGCVEPVTRLAADEGKTVRIPLDPGDNLVMRGREEEFEGFRVRSVVNDERRVGMITSSGPTVITRTGPTPDRLDDL
jgi:hypothetical protein